MIAKVLLSTACLIGLASSASAQQQPGERDYNFSSYPAVIIQKGPAKPVQVPATIWVQEPDGRGVQVMFSDPSTLHRAIVRLPDGKEEVWQYYSCVKGSTVGVTMAPLGSAIECPPDHVIQK